jgi:hypothetical protein
MTDKKDRYFGLSQGDGEVETPKPGFYKGMILKKKENFDESDESLDDTIVDVVKD